MTFKTILSDLAPPPASSTQSISICCTCVQVLPNIFITMKRFTCHLSGIIFAAKDTYFFSTFSKRCWDGCRTQSERNSSVSLLITCSGNVCLSCLHVLTGSEQLLLVLSGDCAYRPVLVDAVRRLAFSSVWAAAQSADSLCTGISHTIV